MTVFPVALSHHALFDDSKSIASGDAMTTPFAALSLNSPSCRPSPRNEGETVVKAVVNPAQLHPQKRTLTRVPSMPEAARTTDRYYFFGWPVQYTRLIELAKKSGYPPQQCADEYTMFDGLLYVERVSGYKWAYPTLGVVEPGCEEYALSAQAPFPGEKVMPMITVFTNSRTLADRRPTVQQMQRLLQIFDYREPKWYKDARPREDFSLYCM
ncbi:hypothetical protein Hypma_014117 [Hypsizygus marmoreus]|uniref:Uncharacterized protein n=1 Tax=Hypsizygus marmoreus TaxID=39966 RepID=A0A369K954_HYPMA|nr:hypothetical protein Hypma_014117 [Hypsizygus marmoreus]